MFKLIFCPVQTTGERELFFVIAPDTFQRLRFYLSDAVFNWEEFRFALMVIMNYSMGSY